VLAPSVKYHPLFFVILTMCHYLVRGHCLLGSLTGAVACKRVTQVHKGWLSPDGNRTVSVKVKASLTARHTSRAGAKAGLSDPHVANGST